MDHKSRIHWLKILMIVLGSFMLLLKLIILICILLHFFILMVNCLFVILTLIMKFTYITLSSWVLQLMVYSRLILLRFRRGLPFLRDSTGLIFPITLDEITNAIFGMDGCKAHRVDSFTIAFFQRAWPII